MAFACCAEMQDDALLIALDGKWAIEDREWGGAASSHELKFCPYCGSRLPEVTAEFEASQKDASAEIENCPPFAWPEPKVRPPDECPGCKSTNVRALYYWAGRPASEVLGTEMRGCDECGEVHTASRPKDADPVWEKNILSVAEWEALQNRLTS